MSGPYASYNPAGQYTFPTHRRNKYKTPGTLGSTIQRKRKRQFDQAIFEVKRRITFDSAHMNQLTRSRKYKRYQKYSLKKHIYPSSATVEDRFQGLTNYDTNSGYQRLSQTTLGSGGTVTMLPIHIMDLTSFQAGASVPEVVRHLGWNDRTTTSNITYNPVCGQSPTGAPATGTLSWTVTDAATSSIAATPRVFLKWIKLSFNLYGARNRTTRFNLKIVRFPQLNQNLFSNTTTAEAKELLQYLERPLIFNNLQVGETECRKKMNIIKEYNWTVQPMTNDSLNTTTGNIKEAHVFLRMNKCINLHWPDEGTHEAHQIPAGEANDGIDYEVRTNVHKTGGAYGGRVYAILSAFSPVNKDLPNNFASLDTPSQAYARTGVPANGTAIDASVEPSYDFMIRRGYIVEAN